MSGAIVHEEVQRELGKHDGLIMVLQKDMAEVKQDVKVILEAVNRTKGGWQVLTLVAAIGGTCGAVMTKLISVLWYLPK